MGPPLNYHPQCRFALVLRSPFKILKATNSTLQESCCLLLVLLKPFLTAIWLPKCHLLAIIEGQTHSVDFNQYILMISV